MKKSSRIKLLLLCLIISIVSFAFACDSLGGSTGGNGGSTSSDIVVDDYVDNGRILNYNTYGEVKVDGILDDEVWANQRKLNRELVVGGSNYAVEMSGYLADNGVVMYIQVETDGGVYVNPLRGIHDNSGVEVYISSGDKTAPQMNSWEIPLQASGAYGTGLFTWNNSYTTGNCYVDVKTQIDGFDGTVIPSDEVNLSPDQTAGYTIEFYIPYSKLNEGLKPSSIAMTGAILHMASYTSTTRNWVDIHSACDGTSGFSNLANRYIFNEQGYLDTTITTSRTYTVNGVEGSDGVVENGYLELDIPDVVGKTGSITAIPNSGYMFDYLIVNGAKQPSPFFEIKKNMGDMDIQVGFKSLDGVDVVDSATIKLSDPKAAPVGYTLEGKTARLFSAAGIFESEIVNGEVSFENIPVGKYTATIKELAGLDADIVFEKDVTEYTVEFEFELFTDTAASFDEATGTYTIDVVGNKLNNTVRYNFAEGTGTMVWAEMTVGFNKEASGVGDADDVLLTSIMGVANGSTMDIGLWWLGSLTTGNNAGVAGKELRLRNAGNASWASKPLSELTTESSTDDLQTRLINGENIQIAISLSGRIASILYRMEGDANWNVWMTLNNYEQITGYSARSVNDKISKITVANTASMFDANLTQVSTSVNDETMGTVSAKGSIFGGDIKVTPQPAEGYIVYDIQVNGVSYPFAVAEFNATGRDVIVPGSKSFTNEVYVEFGPAIEATEYTFTIVDTNGNLVNGEVAFVAEGFYSPVANVVDGVVTIALQAGVDYAITIKGYTSAIVSVSAEGEVAETTFILTKGILYTDSLDYTYGINAEDGNWWTAEVGTYNTPLFIDETDWAEGKALSFHYDALLNTRQFPGIKLFDGNSFVAFQFAIWDGFMDLKISAPSLYAITRLVQKGPARAELDIKIYIEGSTVVFTVDGNQVALVDLSEQKDGFNKVDRVGFFLQVDTVADFKISNITVSEDKYNFVDVNVKDASDDEFTTVSSLVTILDEFALSVNSLQILAGNTATITVLPGTTADFESYFIKSITIDGVKQSFEMGATGEIVIEYVVPAGATSIDIVVETAVQTQVEGTMKVYLASYEGNEIVTDLSKLLFNGANLSDATIDADGTISFTLNTGVYAVEYADAGYEVASLALDDSGEEIVIYLNKVIFDAPSDWEISYDYNGEGVSISKYTKQASQVFLKEETELVGYSFKFVMEGNGGTRTFPYVYVIDEFGIAAGYQICVWDGSITIKPAIKNLTTNGVENRILAQIGQCKTGIFSADVSFFAVGTDLVIAFTNVISNGQPAKDVIHVEDFSVNGTLANVNAGGGATVSERFAGNVKGLMLNHNNDGPAGEAKYWAFENFEILSTIPSAEIVTTSIEGAEVASSANSVAFGSSATITVTPASDVLVKAVIVNGVEYAVAAEIGAPVVYTLSNKSLIDLYEVSAVVASDFASGTITIANGKTIGATGVEDITFDLSSKAFALLAGGSVIVEGTLVGGVLTFADIPFGTYTVSIDNGNFVGEIVIGEADIDETVVVNAVLFSGSEDAMTAPHSKISLDTLYTGDAIVYGKGTDKNIGLYFNEGAIGGKVVWAEQVVTLNAVNEETWIQGFGFRPFKIDNGNYKQLTAGVRFVPQGHGENKSGSNEFQARFNDVAWTSTLLEGTQNKSSVTLKLVAWVENGAMTLRVYDYATGAILATQTNNAVAYEYISHIENKNNRNTIGEVVHSLKISTTIPGAVISTVDGEDYTIDVNKTVVKSGETVTITVNPAAENVLVGSVLVNGQAITPAFDNGVYTTTWTNNDKGLSEVEIKAITTTAVPQDYTLALGWKFANDAEFYPIADGKKVTFVGQYMTKEVVVVDGKVTVNLVEGIYDVILPDGTKTEFEAKVGDAVVGIYAERQLKIDNSITITNNADGSFNVANDASVAGDISLEGTNLAGLTMAFDYSISTTGWAGAGVVIVTENGTKTEFNLLNGSNGTFMIKIQSPADNGPTTKLTGALVDAPSTVAISEDGKTITIKVTAEGNTITRVFTADSVIKNIFVGNIWKGTNFTWGMKNFKVSDMAKTASATFVDDATVGTFTTVDTIVYGKNEIVFNPANNAIVTAIKANGIELPAVLNDDGTYTVTINYAGFENSFEFTVEGFVNETFATVTLNVSGLIYGANGIESANMVGKTVTLDGAVDATGVIAEDGSVVIADLPYGEYAVVIDNYTVTSGAIVVDADEVSANVTATYNLLSGGTLANQDMSKLYTDGSISYVKSGGTQKINTAELGKIIYAEMLVEHDITVEGKTSGDTTGAVFGYANAQNGYGYTGVNVGYNSNGFAWRLRVHNSTSGANEWAQPTIAGYDNVDPFKVIIAQAHVGTQVYAFVLDADTREVLSSYKLSRLSNDTGISELCAWFGDGNTTLSNIKLSTTLPTSIINVVEGDTYTISSDKEAISWSEKATVTIKANDGYKVTNVIVTGATFTTAMAEDGSTVVTIVTASIDKAITISAETEAFSTIYNASVTLKNDGVSNPLDWDTYVAEGTTVNVYAGDVVYATAVVGANGLVELSLENGTYTVVANNYFGATVVVDGEDVVVESTVSYKMFADNDAISQAMANGEAIKTSADPNFSANVVYAEMVIKTDAYSGADKGLAGFKAGYTDGTYGNFEIQKNTSDAFFARACSVDGNFTASKVANSNYIKSVYTTEGFKVAMAVINGRPTVYAQDANGNLVPCVYDSIKALDTLKVLGLHICSESTIVSIKTYTTLDNEYVQSIINPVDEEYEDFVVGTKNTFSNIHYFDANEKNVVEFDITWASGSGDRFYPCIFFNGYSIVQFCVWDGGLFLKPNFSGTGQVTLASKNNGVQTVTVRIKAGDDGRVTFYKVVNGQESFVSNFTAYGGVWKNAMMKAVNSIQFWMDGIDGVATDTSSNAILNGNPFAITNFKVFDSSVPAEINYEENAELYTFTVAPATVAYGSTETIVITPVENAVITAVKANGTALPVVLNDDGTYTATLNHNAFINSYDITVEGEIIETLSNVTLSVSGLTYGIKGVETANFVGKTVTVKGTVEKSGVIGEDGTVVIDALPYGEYVVAIDNFAVTSGSIVLDAEEVSANVTANAIIFSGSETSLSETLPRADLSGLYVEGQDAIAFSQEKVTTDLFFNEAVIGGKVVFVEQVVTYEKSEGEAWLHGVNARPWNSSNKQLGAGIRFNPKGHGENLSGEDEFQLRFNDVSWTKTLIPGTSGASAITIKLVSYVENGVLTLKAYDVETNKLLASQTNNGVAYTHISNIRNSNNSGTGNVYVHSLKIGTALPVAYIADIAESDLYTAEVDKASVANGESVTITATPAENTIITAINVNGTSYNPTFADGKYTLTWTNNDKGLTEVKVEIVATQKVAQLYTINVGYKTVNDLFVGSAEGATLTFAGELMTKTATIVDGKVEVELVEGEYDVTLNEVGAKATFVATENVEDAVDAITMVLTPDVSKVTSYLTTNEDGTISIVGDSSAPENTVITIAKGTNLANVLVNFDYSIDAGTGWAGLCIRLYSANGTKSEFNLLNGANSTLRIKLQSPANDGSVINITGPIVDAAVYAYIAEDGKTITIVATAEGKTVTRVFTADSAIASLEMGCAWKNTPNWAMENIKVSNAKTGVSATFVENAELGAFEAIDTIKFGANTIVFTPNENAVVTAIKANGVKLPITLNENGSYTATLNYVGFESSFEITVEGEVRESNVEYDVALTLKNDGVSNPLDWDAYVAEGTKVTVYLGEIVCANAVVGADGLVELKLVDGTYTVVADNYFGATLVVEGANVVTESVVSYKMFSNNDAISQAIANGTTIKTDADPNFSANVVYAEMVIYHDAFLGSDKGLAGFKSAYVGTESYSNFEIQKTDKDYLQARPCGVDSVFVASKAASNDYLKSVYSTTGYTVAMAIIDGTPIFYAQNSEGKLVPAVYDSIRGLEATKVLGLHVCTEGTIVSIKTYTTLDNEYVQSVISPADGKVATDFSVNTKNTHSDVLYFDASEDNVIEFDFTWTSKSGDRFYPWVLLNGYTPIQLCVWDGAVYLKPNASNTGSATLATKNDGIQSATIRIKADADGRMGFYKVVNGQETFLTNFTAYGSYCKNIYMEDIYSIQFCVEGIDSFADTSSNEVLNGNPFAITNLKVFDASVPAEINYSENAELYTFTVAPATVAYGSTETIVITPVENAVITAVKANGIELPVVLNEDGTYTVTLANYYLISSFDITVEGEIVETLSNATLSVSGLTIGATGIEVANMVGKTVTLKGDVEKSGVIGEDGSVVIENLPYGEYSISIPSFTLSTNSIVLDAEEVSLDLSAEAIIFSGSDTSLTAISSRANISGLYTEGADAIVYSASTSSAYLNINQDAIGGKAIFVEQVVTVQKLSGEAFVYGVRALPRNANNSYFAAGLRYVNAGHKENKSGTNEYQARFMDVSWTNNLVPTSENVETFTVKMVTYIDGGVFYLKMYDVNTGALLVSQSNNAVAYTHIQALYNGNTKNEGTEVVHSIKIATSIPGAYLADIAESDLYTAEVDKEFVKSGESVTISITPAENVIIGAVIINGTTLIPTLSNGVYSVVWTNNDKGLTEVKVEIVATQKIAQTYTLDVDYMAVNDSDIFAIEGGILTFVGEFMTKTATVVDGKVEVELVDGEYEVTHSTVGAKATFVATENVEDAVEGITMVLTPDLATAKNFATSNEDGTISIVGGSSAPANSTITIAKGTNLANVLVNFDYSIDATGYAGLGIRIYSANGTKTEFNLLNCQNKGFLLKNQTANANIDGTYFAHTGALVDAESYAVISEDGKTITMAVLVGANLSKGSFTADSVITSLEMGCIWGNTPNWAMENIAVLDARVPELEDSSITVVGLTQPVINEDGTYNYTSSIWGEGLQVAQGENLAGTIVTFDYSIKLKAGVTTYEGQGIKLFTETTGTNFQRFNLLNGASTNIYIKDQNGNDNGPGIPFTDEVKDAKVKVAISEDGKTVTISLVYNDQEITREWTDESVIITIQIGHFFGGIANIESWSMNNIDVFNVLANA